MRLALFEPDIPQNTGTLMRLCACLGIALDVIEPCGFLLTDKNLRRAGMDYLSYLDWQRHENWASFKKARKDERLILLTTKASQSFIHFSFQPSDVLIVGRESSGVPDEVHLACTHHILVPMMPQVRSLNVAVAASMVIGEALRQNKMYSDIRTYNHGIRFEG